MVGAVDADEALVLEAVVVEVVLVRGAEVFGLGQDAGDELDHGVVGEPRLAVAAARVLLPADTAAQLQLCPVSLGDQLQETVWGEEE